MLRYPDQTALVADLAGMFTAAKWILLGVSFLLLLIGAVVLVWRWFWDRVGQ